MNPFKNENIRELINDIKAVLAMQKELKDMIQDVKDNQSELKTLIKKSK